MIHNLHKPSYTPNTGSLYFPSLEKDLWHDLVRTHEFEHMRLSRLPANRFLRIISKLIYYEYSREKYSKADDISILSPPRNPLVRTLGSFYDLMNRSVEYVQEAFAIRENFQQYKSKKRDKGIPPKKWLSQSISSMDYPNRGFNRICKKFCLTDQISRIKPEIALFSLSPSFFLPSLPVGADGKLDKSRFTDVYVNSSIVKFRKAIQRLPYSPHKRFLELLTLVEEMVERNITISPQSFVNRLRNHEEFQVNEKPERIGSIFLSYERQSNASDPFHDQGIKIPYEDFKPIDSFVFPLKHTYSIYKANPVVDKLMPDKVIRVGARYQALRKMSELCTLNLSATKKILKDKIRYRVQQLSRNEGYLLNWPLSSFLQASEILKQLVFDPTTRENPPSRLTLVEYFELNSVEDALDNYAVEEAPMRKGLNSTYDISPFISLKVKEKKNFEGMDIFLDY